MKEEHPPDTLTPSLFGDEARTHVAPTSVYINDGRARLAPENPYSRGSLALEPLREHGESMNQTNETDAATPQGDPINGLQSTIYTENDPGPQGALTDKEYAAVRKERRESDLSLFHAFVEGFTSRNYNGDDDGEEWEIGPDSLTIRFRKDDDREPIDVRSRKDGIESDRDKDGRILSGYTPREASTEMRAVFESEDPRPIRVYGVHWALERTHVVTMEDGQLRTFPEKTLYFVSANGSAYPRVLPKGDDGGAAFATQLNARNVAAGFIPPRDEPESGVSPASLTPAWSVIQTRGVATWRNDGVHEVSQEARFLSLRPFLIASEALVDKGKDERWRTNPSENTVDYARHEKEPVTIYYPNRKGGPVPAKVYSDTAASAEWFGATLQTVAGVGVLELQIFIALQHHYIAARKRAPSESWVTIDLFMLARYMGYQPETWSGASLSKWGYALRSVLDLHARGEWQEHGRGRNADRLDFRVGPAPLIHHQAIEARTGQERSGQHVLGSEFPFLIRYNLGPSYEDYLLRGKTQEVLLPPRLLLLDHDKQGDIVRLVRAYAVSFRMHNPTDPRGCICGWSIKRHFDEAKIAFPVWAKSEPRKFTKLAMGWIVQAAEAAEGVAEFYDDEGRKIDDWGEGLKTGSKGFEQWQKRVVRIKPATIHSATFVKTMAENRKKVAPKNLPKRRKPKAA